MKNIKFLKREIFFLSPQNFADTNQQFSLTLHRICHMQPPIARVENELTDIKSDSCESQNFDLYEIPSQAVDDMNMAIIILCFDEKIARPSVNVVFHFSFICETLGNQESLSTDSTLNGQSKSLTFSKVTGNNFTANETPI